MHILFTTTGGLGDLLTLTPAIKAMKSSFPESSITVLTLSYRFYTKSLEQTKEILNLNPRGGVIEVLTNNPNIDEVIEIDRKGLRLLKGLKKLKMEVKIIKYLRHAKFDIVISTRNNDRFTLWAFLSGAKVRVGQKKQFFRRLLTHTPDTQEEDRGIIYYLCDLVTSAGASIESFKTEFYISKEAKIWADEFIRENQLNEDQILVAVHPGASGLSRIWPPENFAATIDKLQADNKTKVLLCRSDFDEETIIQIKKHLSTSIIEVKTSGSIDRLAAIFMHCKLCITNDSGPRHLTIALGIPSIGIMIEGNRSKWKIYDNGPKIILLPESNKCSFCPAGSCLEKIPDGEHFGAYCIRSVTPSGVVIQVNAILLSN